MNDKNYIVTTSFYRFRPLQWFGIRVSTMVGALLSTGPALIIVGTLREYPAIACFISLGMVVGTFQLMEYFRGGKYENERFEKWVMKLRSPFHKKDLNQEEIARSTIKNDFDWYLPSGDDLIGFKLLSANLLSFETFIYSLIPTLPTYASVKFVRSQRPDFNVPQPLREKNVSQGEYYIFLRIPMQIMGNAMRKEDLKDKIFSLCNKNIKQMTCSEISEVAELTYFPLLHTTQKTPPFFRSHIEISQGLGKGLWPEKNIASLSLVQIPENKVSSGFEKIFNSVSHLPSTICVTVERIELSKVKKAYWNHFNRKHNKIEDNSINMQTQVDAMPVKMHFGILLHGNEKEISQAIFDLDMACIELGSEFKPIFGQDLGFLKNTLSLYLPGSRPLLPLGFRTHTIDSLKELFCYLPKPDFSQLKENYDLIFRTISNKIISIKQDSKFPVAYISDMGAGKSQLLSLNIISHIQRKATEQVAGCYIEIGGSFRFLMASGLADAYFVLRILDDGSISSFQDHPLRAFRAFSEKGHEAAIKWIKILCGIDAYSLEISQKSEHLIAKAVKKFMEQPEDTLEVFFIFLKNCVLEEFPSVSEDPDHLWRVFINNLSRYVRKERWGKIFCPEETKNFDYANAKFVYFSTLESKLEPEAIFKAFFTFAVFISELVAEKYSSNRANPSRIQFMVDEMNVLRKIIPDDLYVDLNSTARKEGKIPMFATQQFVDITLDHNKWGQDKKFRVVKSIKRLWFYQFPGPDSTLAELLGGCVEDPLIQEIHSIADSNLRLKERGIYAWGYLDESKEVKQIIVDVDKITRWACDTNPGGIAVREACLRTNLYDYWTTCRLLAQKIWPIPEQSGIPKETLEKIVDIVLYGGKTCE